MYAEFGASSTDTISLTFTYGSTTSAKTWNVLLRQIPCTASYKWVPWIKDGWGNGHCSGHPRTVSNTSLGQLVRSTLTTLARCWEACTTPTASALRLKSVFTCTLHMLGSQEGYCGVTFKEVSGTTPDAFNLLPDPSTTAQVVCPASFVYIPRLRWSRLSNLVDQNSPPLSVKMVSVVSMTTNQLGTTTLSSLSWQVPILKTDGLQSNP